MTPGSPPLHTRCQVERAAYDRFIGDTIRTGQRIRYLTDALFFDHSNQTLVYTDCSDEADLHRVLVERNLWGVGNGGMVRGVYSGLLFFRYYAALVLIVCR